MVRALRAISLLMILLFVSGFTECYKPVTRSELLPHIKTVAVPAFRTTRCASRSNTGFMKPL